MTKEEKADKAFAELEAVSARTPTGSVWLHIKTGNRYVVTGHAVDADTLAVLVHYRRHCGLSNGWKVWSRAAEVFCDGRFVPDNIEN